MKHPSEYKPVPFGSHFVMVVDAGTTITEERTGRAETVDENSAVTKGRMIYCTQATFDLLKQGAA